MLRRILVPLFLLAAADVAGAASDFLRPGLWEMTMQVDRDGKRVANNSTSRRCITKENLQKEEQATFAPFESGCTSDHTQTGQTIEWSYQCSTPAQMKGSGKLTYTKDRYSGSSESFADLTGGKVLRMIRTQTTFVAKRVGACTAKQAPSPAPRKSPFRKPKEARPVIAKLGD